jgi:hypothetical protein
MILEANAAHVEANRYPSVFGAPQEDIGIAQHREFA